MNYISPDFKVHHLPVYTLYIYSDQFVDRAIVIDKEDNVMACFVHEAGNPKGDAQKILRLPFRSVRILLPHQQLVWIPSEIYKEDDKSNFLPFFEDARNESVFSKEINYVQANALFQYDPLLFNRWQNSFPKQKLFPLFEILINRAQPYVLEKGSTLSVHLYHGKVDLCLFIDGRFMFYNSFEAFTVDDISYFLLQVFQQFNIGEQSDRILFSGQDIESGWGVRIAKFTKDLFSVKSPDRWISKDKQVIAELKNFEILADSALCAS